MVKAFKIILSIIVILITPPLLFSQTNEESQRIAELYELLPIKNNLYGTEVLIFDYKVKGKDDIKDSSMVARITVLQPDYTTHTFEYDTNQLEVIKYEVADAGRIPVKKIILNNDGRVIESSVVNEKLEILSKTFYKYENQKLISEEAFTGYAYLDEPRRLSLITYKYDGNKLIQKSKKYSLNGTHWIQTWTSKFDEYGNEIWMEEIDEGNIITYENEFDNGKMVKSKVISTDSKPRTREIKYNKQGHPTIIHWFYTKNKKNIRLTKYFYR